MRFAQSSLLVPLLVLSGCREKPATIRADDAAVAAAPDVTVVDTGTLVTPAAIAPIDTGPSLLDLCREAGASRIVWNMTRVTLTGKLRKRVMKPAAGIDSSHWHDVFVLDVEDPPCVEDSGALTVAKTVQIDAVYQGTGPTSWYALVGKRVTVEAIVEQWSSGRPHYFEPFVLEAPTLSAAK